MADTDALGVLLSKIVVDLADMKKNLSEGRREMQGFKDMAADVGASVKKALTFTVGILGIGALIGELKGLTSDIIEVGSKLQILKLSAYAVGQNFGYTSGVIDSFVTDLKKVKVSSVDAYQAVSQFASHGLDPSQLQALAQASRDLAVAAGKSPQEMFNLLIDSIVTGTPRALKQAKIPIKEFNDTVLAEGKSTDESLKLSSKERAQVMIDLVLKYAQTVQGVSESTAGAYSRQLGQIKYMAQEAKEVLWDFMEPLLQAITGEKIKVWSDLLGWLKANRDELKQWGTVTGEFIKQVWEVISGVVAWTVQNGDLLKSLLELAVAAKLAGYVLSLAGALQTAGAAAATSGSLAMGAVAGWTALAGSIKLAAVALALYSIYKTFKEPGQLTGDTASGDPFADVAGGAREKDLAPPRKITVPTEQQKFEAFSAAERQRQIDKAMEKFDQEHGQTGGGGKGKGGGGGGKETADNLLAPMLAMFKTKRDAELADSQNSLDLLKSTNNKKRADLEKTLAEGLMDGRTYYLRLQELQQDETTAALAMIDQKKAAQVKAYQESLAQLEADPKLSPEAKAIAQQKLEAENRKALAKLDTEAAQAQLEGEVKVTNELKRQVEVRKQYQQKTEDLNLETNQLLGAITEQEAKLQKLYLDWQRAKEEAFKAGGLTPEYATALDANRAAKEFDVKYGSTMSSISSEFASGVTNIVNGIRQGTLDISNTLIEMFNNIMMAALKPGFDALGQALTSAIKWLLNSLSSSLGGGNLFGGGGGGAGGGMDWDFMYSGGAYAHGAAFRRGMVQAFAGGGIVNRPTLFPMASGAGLMGEAGAEGILPLARIGGDLGVKALFPGTGNVTVINNLGTEANASAKQTDDGLEIVLDKMVANTINRGGLTRKAILNATGSSDRPNRR